MANIIDLGPVMLIPKGVWDAEITYERLNVVRHGSAAWICKVETSTGVEPSEDSTDWLILVKDISSVTSVNGQRGDVIINSVETPASDDDSTHIATTEWVTDKIEALGTDTISTDVEALKTSMLNVEGTANTAVSNANTAISTANNKVSKDGDTMTGALNIAASEVQLRLIDPDFTTGQLPATGERAKSLWMTGNDLEGSAVLQEITYADGHKSFMLVHRLNASSPWKSLQLGINVDGYAWLQTDALRLTFGNGASFWVE